MRTIADIGAAVIGTGFIGTVHVEALRRIGVQVRGVLGSSPERGQARATALGVRRAYDSLEELLEDTTVDVVHVTSPNDLHVAQARDALAAGKHVVCEKPLAMTATESAELVRLAGDQRARQRDELQHPLLPAQPARPRDDRGRRPRRRATGHRSLFPGLAAARERLELAAAAGPWRRPAGRRGHRIALARPDDLRHGQHVVEVMAELSTFIGTRREPTGPVETFATAGSADTREREISTEDTASILLRFDGGARGAVSISQISPGRKNSLVYEIDGSDGAWAWDSEQPDQAWVGHRDRPNEILIRNPALMGEAGQAASALPGRPRRGVLRHLLCPFPGRLRGRGGGSALLSLLLSHVRGRPRRDARRGCDRAKRARGPVGRGGSQRPRRRRRRRARHAGARLMRLGLLTAPFPETPLAEVVDWTAANGFESIEIACWPQSSGPTRRYAGTSHIDVANLSAGQATELADEIAGKGLTISGLGYYPNPLHPDAGHRDTVIGHLRHVITAAEKMNVPFVNTFMGADGAKNAGRQLAGGAHGLAGHRGLRPGPRPPDHDRELPDAVQLRRVAGRAQPRDHATDLAPDPRGMGRHDRAQLRPVPPDPPDDRHPAVHPRVRAAHPPRPGQGPDDRPRRPLRARHLLAGASAGRSRACPVSATSSGRPCSPPCGGPATTAT